MREAIGAYIRTLRNHHGLSQEAVAREIQVSGKQVYNWERGQSLPGSLSLAQLVQFLGGDWTDIGMLLLAEDATEAQGEALALRRIASNPQLQA